MKKINYSIVINQQTEELFSRAYLCTCKGYSVDEDILKPLLGLTKEVYDKGFSKIGSLMMINIMRAFILKTYQSLWKMESVVIRQNVCMNYLSIIIIQLNPGK